MRFLILPTFTILTGGLLLAADSASVTYVDGSIADFAPNSGASLYMSKPQAMELRAGHQTVQVPYSQISKAELGSVQVHSSEPEAAYKVWALPKRLIKTETRQVTMAFTDGNGQDQTMTLELSRISADRVFAIIGRHNAKIANNNWWGDNYCKTNRNKDQWGGAGTVAQK